MTPPARRAAAVAAAAAVTSGDGEPARRLVPPASLRDEARGDGGADADPDADGEPAQLPSFATEAARAEAVRAVQSALDARGFDAGPTDGILGPRTRAAIRDFRGARGLPPPDAAPGPAGAAPDAPLLDAALLDALGVPLP